MGFTERIPGHEVNGEWMPGPTPKHLEDWCAKNCKPVEEKTVLNFTTSLDEPATEEVKMVGSNKNWKDKDKKKD